MSKVSMTVCDGCRHTLEKPEEIALIVAMPVKKIVCHYCWACATPIIDTINKITEKKDGEQDADRN